MTPPDDTLPNGANSAAPSARRRAALFALAMAPFAALIALLAWGQAGDAGNPGGLLVHSESGDVEVAVREAPPIAGADLVSGAQVELASLRGSVVMVDFWSSWCVSCKAEAAALAQVYREYAGAGVEFVGVSIWDRPEDALRHIEQYGAAYPNVLDESGEWVVPYGVLGVPEKFFLDAEGRIVRKVNGPFTAERLRAILDGLLAA